MVVRKDRRSSKCKKTVARRFRPVLKGVLLGSRGENAFAGKAGSGRLSLLLVTVINCAFVAACGGGSGTAAVSNPPPSAIPPTGNTLPGPRPVAEPQSFVAFESGQVRPLAMSADGQRLFAVNTPDNRLEIFSIAGGLAPLASVPVGLEPVALAEDPDGRVWVVNHLSDSVLFRPCGSAMNPGTSCSPARIASGLLLQPHIVDRTARSIRQ